MRDGKERARRRRRLLVALLALAVGILACEGILRWLLFSDSALARDWGAGFRDAGLYTASANSDEYQKLRYLLTAPAERWKPRVPLPELGWAWDAFDPETLRHRDEVRLGGRRPVLLFGSSYTVCLDSVQSCFEQALEGSELARDFCLLNYGASAYGLDQSTLLLSRTAPRFAALAPVVVLSLVVDVDLNRLQMTFFQAPKPRFVEQQGGFQLQPPDDLDALGFIARHPPGITSYLLRYLLYGAGLLPAAWRPGPDPLQRSAERRALAAYCLNRAHAELEALGIEHFVLLFHSPRVFPPLGRPHPDEAWLRAHLREHGIPFVDSRAVLQAEIRGGVQLDQLYQHDPPDMWHPNERGTGVLFRALQQGLEHRYADVEGETQRR